MSRLRAKCPDCRTLTAVAIDAEYQCHSCGRGSRPGSCGFRAHGAAAAQRWPRRRGSTSVSRGGRDRAGHARGADRGSGRRPARAAGRPRRLLLRSRRCDSRARRPCRDGSPSSGWTATATSTLPRRRRPETPGECRSAWRSTRVGAAAGRRTRRRPESRSAGSGLRSRRPGSTPISRGRSTGATAYTWRSTATCYGPTNRVLHAGAGRAVRRRGRGGAPRRCRPSARCGPRPDRIAPGGRRRDTGPLRRCARAVTLWPGAV